ncbi:hypothetical protein [Ornithinimicrobium faecis]|uniref:hypothetical protein n=1 Tax=Ornithinimicrobium faecis TaxID=2934158 RepID=UPI002117E03D|nr:hypothetical protein [Ornithinimicrobium sp. HY1745]
MRILQAPSNVANQSWSTAQGLRERGHEVEVWNYGPSPNDFPVDRVFTVGADPNDSIDALRAALDGNFDVFHFHTTRTLISASKGIPQMWDLPVLRALGKRIVFSFHGSDIRLASHHIDDDPWSFYKFSDIPCDEEKISTRLALIRTYAHAMTVSSTLDNVYVPEATYLPKSLHIPDYAMVGPTRKQRPLIVHATRRRATKGTDLLISELTRLQGHHDFDFKIIEGATHSQLLRELAGADIVVEKLLGGDAGVISLEAMALGKVAIARIREEVRSAHPEIPVVSANPNTFSEVMAELIQSHRLRGELGERGRAYVEAEHSGARAAALLEDIYMTAKPGPARPHPNWASDPSERRLEAAYARMQRLEEQNARLRGRR